VAVVVHRPAFATVVALVFTIGVLDLAIALYLVAVGGSRVFAARNTDALRELASKFRHANNGAYVGVLFSAHSERDTIRVAPEVTQ
jgi:hypothetical protein